MLKKAWNSKENHPHFALTGNSKILIIFVEKSNRHDHMGIPENDFVPYKDASFLCLSVFHYKTGMPSTYF